MSAEDVKTALDTLEAQDSEQEGGRVRGAVKKGVALVRQKSDEAGEMATKAISAVEERTVTSVEEIASLGRLVQDAVLHDARATFDCIGHVAGAKTPVEAIRIQADFVRRQIGVNADRWRSIAGVVGRAAQASTQVFAESLRRPAH